MAQDTLDTGETALAELSDGTTLIQYDDGTGAVRFHEPADDQYFRWEYDRIEDARLAFGLWRLCGPWMTPESGLSVPVEVATQGQAAIAAYLLVGRGTIKSRQYVADQMGVSKQTVSNYANRIRWSADR